MLTQVLPEAASKTTARNVLVAAQDLSLSFRSKLVLDKVSLAIRSSEIVTLIGPNGAGKTTLARALLGLERCPQGCVKRKPGLKIGYVPQRFPIDRIIPMSVLRFMSLSGAVSRQCAMDRLDETGAAGLAAAQMCDLSGGQFQRVLLARALARDPEFLVLDEPAQAVDFAGAAQLYDLIASIRKTRGCGILLISHDLHVVLGASDRVVCLNRHVCCAGKPETVAGHPEYVRLFGPKAAASLGIYEHRHDHMHALSGDVVCTGHAHD